ncbi:MAG: hypothetical protein CMD58_05765 [Gammaproteobacteria bacterium]|nr:hypothetical protein [Gammaproteobacteria bacterium]
MERFIAFVLVLALIPLILPISILIKVTTFEDILFWSERVGSENQLFYMPKFCTMKQDTPKVATHLLKDPEQYFTRVGNFLRKTSLDEIPQLYSIVWGDMSFIGPRPALFNQYDLIKLRTEKGVHKLKPGITGFAQVNGRDSISITEKVLLDEYYLKNKSFFLDIKIIWLTLRKVLSQDDISH